MERPIARLATSALLTIALATSACGTASEEVANDDRAGGAGLVDPTVLTMAQPNDAPPPQLVSWAEEVSRLSNGSLEIEFASGWRRGEIKFEAGIIEDVKEGKVDLAWVGARAFDTVGVNSFQALVAPMLIDSYDLQVAVFEAGIPDQMLGGLKTMDLVGIGVLPGPLRRVLGVSKPFLQPADFENMVVGIQDSEVAKASLDALGATPQPVPSGASLDGLDSYEQQLAAIVGNHYELEADFVSGNINLWPRPLVIVAGAGAFESLDADQQAVLREASANAIPGALDASRVEDTSGAESLCKAGMTFVTASADELATLRSALEPVYEWLAEDPETAQFLDAIGALKEQVSAPPDAPVCARADVGDTLAGANEEASIPNGTYTATLTGADISSSGCDNLAWKEFDDEIQFELTLGDGRIALFESVNGGDRQPGWTGTYSVFRDQIEIQGDYSINAYWTFDGTNLVLSNVETNDCADSVIWTTHPWTLVAG